MNQTLDLFDSPEKTARRRRDTGIARAQGRAERVVDREWTDTAIRMLTTWAVGRGPFLCEQFIEAHLAKAPPDARAWGAVIQAAARRGLIKRVGYAPARTSNLSPKAVWQLVGSQAHVTRVIT